MSSKLLLSLWTKVSIKVPNGNIGPAQKERNLELEPNRWTRPNPLESSQLGHPSKLLGFGLPTSSAQVNLAITTASRSAWVGPKRGLRAVYIVPGCPIQNKLSRTLIQSFCLAITLNLCNLRVIYNYYHDLFVLVLHFAHPLHTLSIYL